MKLWFRVQIGAILLALIYMFFIFNDGYLGKLLLDVALGFMTEWIAQLLKDFIQSIVDTALQR